MKKLFVILFCIITVSVFSQSLSDTTSKVIVDNNYYLKKAAEFQKSGFAAMLVGVGVYLLPEFLDESTPLNYLKNYRTTGVISFTSGIALNLLSAHYKTIHYSKNFSLKYNSNGFGIALVF